MAQVLEHSPEGSMVASHDIIIVSVNDHPRPRNHPDLTCPAIAAPLTGAGPLPQTMMDINVNVMSTFMLVLQFVESYVK